MTEIRRAELEDRLWELHIEVMRLRTLARTVKRTGNPTLLEQLKERLRSADAELSKFAEEAGLELPEES